MWSVSARYFRHSFILQFIHSAIHSSKHPPSFLSSFVSLRLTSMRSLKRCSSMRLQILERDPHLLSASACNRDMSRSAPHVPMGLPQSSNLEAIQQSVNWINRTLVGPRTLCLSLQHSWRRLKLQSSRSHIRSRGRGRHLKRKQRNSMREHSHSQVQVVG